MTISSEISRLQNAKADIKTAIEWKWVEIPNSAKFDDYSNYIDLIDQSWWSAISNPFWSTITISWVEWSSGSDPVNPVRSDWATWATAWDLRFDEWFWYSWVRLSTSWQVTNRITQEWSWWWWKLDMNKLWTLTSWDNVMIEFPVRWIKMTKSWSTVTLSMTKDPWKTWYQYYAFTRNSIIQPALYISAYKWSRISNVTKSWAWQSEANSASWDWLWYYSFASWRSYARANDWWDWTWEHWYEQLTRYARSYIDAMYIMKYWNFNLKNTVWQWYVYWWAYCVTWWTNNQIDATYWTPTSNRNQLKLFWLEDWIWNWYDYLDLISVNSDWNQISLSTTWSFSNYDVSYSVSSWDDWWILSIKWDNVWMFLYSSLSNSMYDNTFYKWTFNNRKGGWVIYCSCAYNAYNPVWLLTRYNSSAGGSNYYHAAWRLTYL